MANIPYHVLDHKVLTDDKPWSLHKSKGMLLADSYLRLKMFKKYDAVRYCGSMLKFMSCPQGHGKRLRWANFCKVRLCPMCSWRKSLLQARQLRQVAHVTAASHKCRWIFLTLTVKNVDGDSLSDEISHLTQSWKRLFERKQFKKTVLGFFRALEVTHNPDTGEYHPHFHALLCVTPSYFTRDYIKQSDWVDLWQQAARLDYKPMVNVQSVKGRRDPAAEERILREKGIHIEVDGIEDHEFLPGKAVAEVAKYTVKAGDFIFPGDERRTDDVVLTLDKALKQRKLYAYGGVMKDAWEYLEKQDKVTDVEDADLVHIDEDDDCKCSVCNSDMLEELYKWIPSRGQYIRQDIPKRELFDVLCDCGHDKMYHYSKGELSPHGVLNQDTYICPQCSTQHPADKFNIEH
jgi:plasmid rolling circle replication initiator protein Rep